MKAIAILSALVLCAPCATADDKFEQDRQAILAMAGAHKVEFSFEETIPIAEGYQLRKPYHEEAKELVKVVADTGTRITLQHLLVLDTDEVIKHWSQTWKYEDNHVLDFEGGLSWTPRHLEEEAVEGTWTQYVTQTDDSPRYKAAGTWVHHANYSVWTSMPGTRPLPRREYTKRSDYEVIECVNRHIVTPTGWVHTQDNHKRANADGKHKVLCIETGLNTYTRVTDDPEQKGFAFAEAFWEEKGAFWAEVRQAWDEILVTPGKPVTYVAKLEDNAPRSQSLSAKMKRLSEASAEAGAVSRTDIDSLLAEHLR